MPNPSIFLNFFLPSHYHVLSSISCLVGVFNIGFFSSDRTSSPLSYDAVFKPWGAYVWFLEWWYVLAVSSVVCPTRTAFPHPLFLSYVFSWSFLCVLVFLLLISMCYSFLLFICTCLAWNDLQATLLFPYLAFSLVELMGNAVFPPSLLPLPPSSPASFACTAQWKALNKKDWVKKEQDKLQVFPCVCFLQFACSRKQALSFWSCIFLGISREINFGQGSSGLTFDFLIWVWLLSICWRPHVTYNTRSMRFLSFSARPSVNILLAIYPCSEKK